MDLCNVVENGALAAWESLQVLLAIQKHALRLPDRKLMLLGRVFFFGNCIAPGLRATTLTMGKILTEDV